MSQARLQAEKIYKPMLTSGPSGFGISLMSPIETENKVGIVEVNEPV